MYVKVCFVHPKFHFWFLVTFGNVVTKILCNLYLHSARQDGQDKKTPVNIENMLCNQKNAGLPRLTRPPKAWTLPRFCVSIRSYKKQPVKKNLG